MNPKQNDENQGRRRKCCRVCLYPHPKSYQRKKVGSSHPYAGSGFWGGYWRGEGSGGDLEFRERVLDGIILGSLSTLLALGPSKGPQGNEETQRPPELQHADRDSEAQEPAQRKPLSNLTRSLGHPMRKPQGSLRRMAFQSPKVTIIITTNSFSKSIRGMHPPPSSPAIPAKISIAGKRL